MFNRKTSILTVFILVSLLAATSAQAGGSIFGGVNFPTGDFEEGAEIGWTAGGYLTFKPIPLLDLGVFGAYNQFNIKEAFHLTRNLKDDKTDIWELHALGQVNILMLKGFAGVGAANYQGFTKTGDTERKTRFAWQIGVAAQILFIEGRLSYHQVDVDAGSLNWMGLTAGITF